MGKSLPPRPHLDHLRRQAKALLSDLANGDAKAVSVIQRHVPAAHGLMAAQILQASFRLADAQLAVAREAGFASWPKLSRHVEQLRALEGTWEFESLLLDGHAMPKEALGTSRLLIDGDRFRTESPEATYEGIFNINVDSEPHEIDIEFVSGPEAGNWNYGIFRVDGDQIAFCLDLNGNPRPRAFEAKRGSGHAFETLRRATRTRPEGVSGGTPPPASPPPVAAAPVVPFEYVPSPTLDRLQGDWSAVTLVRDGQEFPPMMLKTGRRHAEKNDLKIAFAGQVMIHASIRIDENQIPVDVTYANLGGMAKGTYQEGIMKWIGDEACFCMAPPGGPRPTDFASPPGSGNTLSQWRRDT